MSRSVESQVVALTQELLGAIGARDWQKYKELCDESLTCFEPEARGHLVEGLQFHKYYFELPGGEAQDMYRPGIFARQNTARITVLP